MKTSIFPASACRYCRNYNAEGRRGGMCKQLGVPVRGSWKACSLALPPFAPSWEGLDVPDNLMLKEARLNCSINVANLEATDLKTEITPTLTIDILLV